MGKNKIANLLIEKLAFPNVGIAFDLERNKNIYVKGTLPSQLVEVYIKKDKGQLLKILEPSKEEITSLCEDFLFCGGCSFQNIPYDYEIQLKEEMALSLYKDYDYNYLGFEKATEIEGYRNKMEYSFGDSQKGGKLALGMRKRGCGYEVVTSKHCNIVDDDYRKILNITLDYFTNTDLQFYHKKLKTGSLRHLVVRRSKYTNQILINLITTSNFNLDLAPFVDKLLNGGLTGTIVSIFHTINDSVADIVQADKLTLIYGTNHFTEKLCGLQFKISPFSFFQTNSIGAQKLYDDIKKLVANCHKKDIIFDLYCGTGTIAQIVSDTCKEVIAIELVEEAISSAKANAEINNITNCTFIAGDVLKEIDNIDKLPDIIILDPPRDGIHKKAITKIIDFGAKNIIYISCKPTSLARDIQIFLQNGYKLTNIKLHDLFPRTYHIETIALFEKI